MGLNRSNVTQPEEGDLQEAEVSMEGADLEGEAKEEEADLEEEAKEEKPDQPPTEQKPSSRKGKCEYRVKLGKNTRGVKCDPTNPTLRVGVNPVDISSKPKEGSWLDCQIKAGVIDLIEIRVK